MATGVTYDLRFNDAVGDESILGQRKEFQVFDYSTDPVTRKRGCCEAILVANRSGGTLTPGLAVKWKVDATYYPGTAVGSTCGDEEIPAGVVSPFINGSTVADGECFWLIVGGLTKARYDGSANLAIGDQLITAASGQVKEFTPASDPNAAFAGWAVEAKTSGSAGDRFWVFLSTRT